MAKSHYYIEYDEVYKTHDIYVSDNVYEEDKYDYYVASFEDLSIATYIRDCLNDLLDRVYND